MPLTRGLRAGLVLVCAMLLIQPMTPWVARAQPFKEEPPAVAGAILQESLQGSGSLTTETKPGGLASSYTAEGFQFRVPHVERGEPWLISTVQDVSFSEGEVAFEFRFPRPHTAVNLWVALSSSGAGSARYFVELDQPSKTLKLEKRKGESSSIISEREGVQEVTNDAWHQLAIRRKGSGIWVLLNGQPMLFAEDTEYASGPISISMLRRLGDFYRSPSVLQLRNLRISAIQGGRTNHTPVRGSTRSAETTADQSGLPALGAALLDPGALVRALRVRRCDQASATEDEAGGVILRTAGRCLASESFGGLAALAGVAMGDGDVEFELGAIEQLNRGALELSIASQQSGATYAFRLTFGPVGAFIARSDASGFSILSRGEVPGVGSPADVTRIGARVQNGALWMLVNGQAVARVAQGDRLDGRIALLYFDQQRPPDGPPISVTVRSVTLSSLAAVDEDRLPRLSLGLRWHDRPGFAGRWAPLLEAETFRDALLGPGALTEVQCTSQLGSARFTPEGMRMLVRGGCISAAAPPRLIRSIEGATMREGTVTLEFRAVSPSDRTALVLGFRQPSPEREGFALQVDLKRSTVGLTFAGAPLPNTREGEIHVPDLRHGWHALRLETVLAETRAFIDDVPVFSTPNSSGGGASLTLGILRGEHSEDEVDEGDGQAGVDLRNLRIAEWDVDIDHPMGGPSRRVLAAAPPFAISTEPPALGETMLVDPLTVPGLLAGERCLSGLASGRHAADGLVVRVRGECGADAPAHALLEPLQDLVFEDGEIRLDVHPRQFPNRALVRLYFHTSREGAYVAELNFGRQTVALGRIDRSSNLVLAGRSDALLPHDVPTTLAVRSRGSEMWLLINDVPVLAASDSVLTGTGAAIEVIRQSAGALFAAGPTRLESPDELEVVIRDLQVSALQEGTRERAPRRR